MQYAPYIRVVEGAETAVLLIHGIVGTPAHFKDLLPLAPDDVSIYNILLDGHGKGVKDFAKTSMAKWKAQVSGQLDEILQAHKKVLIVGHSLGTLLAIGEAIKRPDKVTGLFLQDIPLIVKLPPSTAISSVQAALGLAKEGSAARAMLDDAGVHLSPNLLLYLAWLPRFWELLTECHSVRNRLEQLRVPARAYTSRKDELVSFRTCRILDDHPTITNTVLPDSGHFAYGKDDLTLMQTHFQQMLQSI